MLINLLLLFVAFIIPSEQWDGTPIWNKVSVPNAGVIRSKYSHDDQFYLLSGYKFLKAFYSETRVEISQVNLTGRTTTYVYACEFSRDQKYVGYVGNGNPIYIIPFPELTFPSTNYTYETNNTYMYDLDFNSDGSEIIACGNKEVVIINTSNKLLLKSFPVTQTYGSTCEYSDTDKYGWTDGYSIRVVNSNFTTFFQHSVGAFINIFNSIKFLLNDPYPIVLISGTGIIKTAASASNWKIIRLPNVGMASMDVSKNGKYIIIAGNENYIAIYSITQFVPFDFSDTTYFDIPPHTSIYETSTAGTSTFNYVTWSNLGNNAMATGSSLDYFTFISICNFKKYLHWNCTFEICGDLEAHKDKCDLELANKFDGCTDECTVEDGFTCSVNSTDLKTLCSYNGKIQLKFINISKNEEFNEHTIVLSIFPPLFSIKNLNESQLSELFGLPPQYNGISYTYNGSTGEIWIKFELTENIIDGSFYIDFNPEKIGIDEYFASTFYKLELTHNENFQINPIFISSKALHFFKKTNSIISVFIPIAAWLLFFAGLFTKSLSGLEALMTFQFCGLTLHWLETQIFFGLEGTFSMKYLSGYNVIYESDLLGISTNTTKDYDILQRFGIDLNYFANNLNLTLFLFVPFLFAFLVINVLIFKKRKEITENNPNLLEIEKLKQYKYSSLDFILYSVSAIYIPFIEYFILFIETGQKSHQASWIISLIYLLILLFFLLSFFMNPSNFETFWFSFRIHRILLHHYCFLILSFTLAIIFLIKLPNLPYFAVTPCIIMFIYTLFQHPYKSLKENLRSAFNLFVVLCFLSLNILVVQISKEQTNHFSANILLGVNLAVLLPIVFILSFASCLYHCYQKFYVVPKEMALKANDKTSLVEKSILVELNKANLEKQMKRNDQSNEFFRKFVIPSESIYDYSNRLIMDNEIGEFEEDECEENSQRNVNIKESKTQIKHIKIPNLRKEMMLNKPIQKQDPNIREDKLYSFMYTEQNGEILTEIQELNENEEPNENELVKDTIKDENLFINTKHIVKKVDLIIEDNEKHEVENEIFLEIYDGIKKE